MCTTSIVGCQFKIAGTFPKSPPQVRTVSVQPPGTPRPYSFETTSSRVAALSRASTLQSRSCPLSPFSPSVQLPSRFSPADDLLLPLSSFPPVNPHLPSSLPSPPPATVPSILLRLPPVVGSSLLHLYRLQCVVQLLSLLRAPTGARSCQQKPSTSDIPILSLPSSAPPCCISVVSGASSSYCLFSKHLQKPEAASRAFCLRRPCPLPPVVGSSLSRLCHLWRVVQLLSLLRAPVEVGSYQQKPSTSGVLVLSLRSSAPPCCVSIVFGESSAPPSYCRLLHSLKRCSMEAKSFRHKSSSSQLCHLPNRSSSSSAISTLMLGRSHLCYLWRGLISRLLLNFLTSALVDY